MTDEEKERLKNNICEALQMLLLVKRLEVELMKFNLALMEGLKAGELSVDDLAQQLIACWTEFNGTQTARYDQMMHRLWLLDGGVLTDTEEKFSRRQLVKFREAKGKMEKVRIR